MPADPTPLVSHGLIYSWLQDELTRMVAAWDKDPSDALAAQLVLDLMRAKVALADARVEYLHAQEAQCQPAP